MKKKTSELTPEEWQEYRRVHRYTRLGRIRSLQKKREEYHWYKEHSICTECHHEPVRPGYTLCEACAKRKWQHQQAKSRKQK